MERSRRVRPLVELFERIERDEDAHARDLARTLAGELLSIYGEGLARLARAVESEAEGSPLRRLLVDDPVVASLLLVHGLYPVDLETRVRRALERVRPFAAAHRGSIELVALEAGVARLRLGGSCDGCAAASLTLDRMVRSALEAEAPDLVRFEVDGAGAPRHAEFAACEGAAASSS